MGQLGRLWDSREWSPFHFWCPMLYFNSALPVSWVVPHVFDPYRASFIAHDHLLIGHFRVCVALTLSLLPSQKHRELCERVFIRFMLDAKLTSQVCLEDPQKKALFSMPITAVYDLFVWGKVGFVVGCEYATPQSSRNLQNFRQVSASHRLEGKLC